MDEALLDRPVWHALRTQRRDFAVGTARALRFAPDVGPLAGTADDTAESLRDLAGLIPAGGSLMLMQADPIVLAAEMVTEKSARGVQMVGGDLADVPLTPEIVHLSERDVPEMVALASLTAPGPFLAGTHRLGGFCGVRRDGRLVAMAGERMRLPGMTELSGVCTHPDTRGRGYARMLSAAVAKRIVVRGETPILHVYAANAAAIALYRSLGFRVRTEVDVALVRRR